jgi:hypothetical protein
MLLPLLAEDKFNALFNDLLKKGFWCYQGETAKIAYEYFQELHSIRFARKDQMFPNMEVIPVTRREERSILN